MGHRNLLVSGLFDLNPINIFTVPHVFEYSSSPPKYLTDYITFLMYENCRARERLIYFLFAFYFLLNIALAILSKSNQTSWSNRLNGKLVHNLVRVQLSN